MTNGLTNCQQTCKCSMDFSFCQFSEVDIHKLGDVVPIPIVFISTPDEMNMGVENPAVCF